MTKIQASRPASSKPSMCLLRLTKWGRTTALACALVLTIVMATALAQTRTYPDKIRGYKVERTVVEMKRPEGQSNGAAAESDVDSLIKLGDPKVARMTPLGITFEVPIVVAPVKQSGHVDFLVFEDMSINGRSVD